MDSRVITITSGKGGVGKTTTTANVGTALAMQGKKVAVVDSDIGLRNLDAVLGLENRIVYDLVDVVEGQCRLRQALIKDKRLPELYLLPAAQTRDKNAINSVQMEQLCQQLRQEFEFVVIDSPAGIEQGFRNAIVGADEIIILGIVPEDEMIIVATNKGEPVVYDKRSRSGRAFVNAALRILGDEIPLDEVAEAPTLMERLRKLVGFGPALAEKRIRS